MSEKYNKETGDAVYFYTSRFYELDNFSAHAVENWDRVFPTSEHAYQWKKFIDRNTAVADSILNARSPQLVKNISNDNKSLVSSEWDTEKVGVMEEILRVKLSQHADVEAVLRSTGSKMIIENSPSDSFWGIGPTGEGENNLGKIWMKLRNELSLEK